MKFSSTIFASLVLAAAGCAADAPTGDGGDDDGGGGGGGGDPSTDMNAAGKYSMRSSFDFATNAPGTAGDVANAIIDATDDGDDPTSWILDRVIDAMPDGSFKNFMRGAKPYVSGYINDRLLEIAPDFVGKMIHMGANFGDASKHFGLNEVLDVTGSPGSYSATRVVRGTHFKIDNVESDFAFADYGSPDVVVPGIGMTIDQTGKLSLTDHKVPLSFGKVLRIALDAAIIPAIEPGATNLVDLFEANVNCDIVAEQMETACEDYFGFGPGEGTFRSACHAGLNAGASYLYGKLDGIDGNALELGVTGTGKILDKDGDANADTIQSGTWTGTTSYAGTPAPLEGATFFGARQ